MFTKIKDAMPKSLQATLDRTWNYTDRGNLSMVSWV